MNGFQKKQKKKLPCGADIPKLIWPRFSSKLAGVSERWSCSGMSKKSVFVPCETLHAVKGYCRSPFTTRPLPSSSANFLPVIPQSPVLNWGICLPNLSRKHASRSVRLCHGPRSGKAQMRYRGIVQRLFANPK